MATLLFDSWGTLVDNYSISEVLEPHVHSSRMGNYIAEEWRTHQKWMMFYLTLAEHFLPHPGTTESALRYTLDKFHIKLSEAAIKDIMSKYHQLRAYPDVPEGLRRLKEQGHVLKIVANPTKQMLEDHTKYAGIREYLDEIISSGDEAKAFKPSPKVYQLGLARAGHRVVAGAEIWPQVREGHAVQLFRSYRSDVPDGGQKRGGGPRSHWRSRSGGSRMCPANAIPYR